MLLGRQADLILDPNRIAPLVVRVLLAQRLADALFEQPAALERRAAWNAYLEMHEPRRLRRRLAATHRRVLEVGAELLRTNRPILDVPAPDLAVDLRLDGRRRRTELRRDGLVQLAFVVDRVPVIAAVRGLGLVDLRLEHFVGREVF